LSSKILKISGELLYLASAYSNNEASYSEGRFREKRHDRLSRNLLSEHNSVLREPVHIDNARARGVWKLSRDDISFAFLPIVADLGINSTLTKYLSEYGRESKKIGTI
jgi:hypothetical protein